MGADNLRSPSTSGRWRYTAGAAALMSAFAAQAAEPARNDGVMQFKHARVEVLSPDAVDRLRAASGLPVQESMRAYLDPTTRRLVQPTAEAAAALQAAKPKTAVSPALRAAPRWIYPARGGVGMVLDPSMDSHSVATRAADGAIDTACVPDQATAMQMLKTEPMARQPHLHETTSSRKPAQGEVQ